MTSSSALQALVFVAVVSLSRTAPVLAQSSVQVETDKKIDALLEKQWNNVLREVATRAGLVVTELRPSELSISGTPEQKQPVYEEVIERLILDVQAEGLLTPEYIDGIVKQQPDLPPRYIAELAAKGVESRVPVSNNAASTNPATSGLIERSGATSLAALAADLSSLVAADKTAISLNLSALALVSLRDETLYSTLANYQRHNFARRFSGTVVFGAKIPEKEITGLSGVPEFEQLLDAFSWDVKARVWGDKDPRNARWHSLTVGRMGLVTQKAALFTNFAGTDAAIVSRIISKSLGDAVSMTKRHIARAPQLSLKVAGTHLTKETGKNRYSAAALFDQGIGPVDLTANVQYAITDDVRLGATQVFQTKIWLLAAGVTSHLAADAIVKGRSVDVNVGISTALFQDKGDLPILVENTWKLFTTIDIPVRGGGKIPVSIIYSNDPNALAKQKYVTGLIGLSYDFSALKSLFTGS